ncbi:universal stress protein [Leifsonia sp. A12D58]|uniref:universal stress protein n=1 Tax=Leifsonia sp. A12D58 TaxID=3397674 RepID=UPI0039E11FBC
MAVVVWITENTWRAAVDAASSYAESGSDIILVHVRADDVAQSVHGAFAGLLGRGRPDRDPGRQVETLSVEAARALLERAAERLGYPAARRELHGRVEREVVQAADGAELLICVRDGDRSRLGPHSLGPATRFVVDHAPCPVLLVWPEPAPGLTSIPAPPPD